MPNHCAVHLKLIEFLKYFKNAQYEVLNACNVSLTLTVCAELPQLLIGLTQLLTKNLVDNYYSYTFKSTMTKMT